MGPLLCLFFLLNICENQENFHIADFEHEDKDTIPISKAVLNKIPLFHKDIVIREAQSNTFKLG